MRGAAPVEWARPLPDVRFDRGATETPAKLQNHLHATPHRVLPVAEREGRRQRLVCHLTTPRLAQPRVATVAELEKERELVKDLLS